MPTWFIAIKIFIFLVLFTITIIKCFTADMIAKRLSHDEQMIFYLRLLVSIATAILIFTLPTT